MISLDLADIVLGISLTVSLFAYWLVARHERSFLNILTPDYAVWIPALYIFPAVYAHFFGTEGSSFAFTYVYATIAVENLVFALLYIRPNRRVMTLPFSFAYRNFTPLAFLFLVLSFAAYLPVLLEFPQYLFDPRQIYAQTRIGYGGSFFISSTLAYLAVIFILFSARSWWVKSAVILCATAILSLHGSKGQVLVVFFLIGVHEVYVKGRRVRLLRSLVIAGCLGVIVVVLFAATMVLGESPLEALEAISQYSDYTRNAMLVIDQHFPPQYGRLTLESNIYGLVPRVLMPTKPKDFGPLLLAEEYFPDAFDEEQGAPAFGVGLQYADFGFLAVVYLALFAAFRGWLARIFVDRLTRTRHPGDFVIVAFLAGISLFPLGVGWLLPETIVIAFSIRYLSTWGYGATCREARRTKVSLVSNRLAVPGTDPA